MKLSQVDLNLFVVFEVIYTERNTTRAADILCLSQPAVSNALGRLRRVMDDPLFVRTPQGMLPTPLAERLIAPVREALSLLERGVNEGQAFDPLATEKTYRLSMNDLAGSLLLPPLLKLLETQAPKSSVSSYYLPRSEAPAALASGLLDVVIDAPLLKGANLCQLPLSSQPYVCVMRRGHPLQRRRLTLEAYLGARHIHVSGRRRGRGHVDIALNRLGKKRNIVMRTENYLQAARIVDTGDYLWTVPAALAAQLSLTVKPLPFDVEELDWHLYWHKSADSDPSNRWLREKLLEVVGQNDDRAV